MTPHTGPGAVVDAVAELQLAELQLAELHTSLSSPISDSMNFLNEVAQRYPDAISLAAGRPYEGFLEIEAVTRHIETYRTHLRERYGHDEAQVRRTMLQYGRTKGIIHDLVARHLAVDEGITADPESIVVTVGCQEALYLTLRALRRTERDVLLAVVPSYVGLTGAAQLADMRVLPVRTSDEGIDFDHLAAVVARAKADGLRPRGCYVVADFANPTGTSLDLDTRERLLRAAEEHDFLILEDNPYGFFGDGSAPLPTLKALDRAQRVVYLGSFAKTGLPGARVGYVVADQWVAGPGGGRSRLADQLAKIKSMLTVNTSPVAQAVIGGKLLEHDCSLRAANAREIRVYRDNLRMVLDGLAARFPQGSRPAVTWNVPRGGFFVVLTLPFVAGDDLLEESALRHGVLWTPMHHFYGDGRPRREIRLSVSHLTPEEITEGLDRLAAFARAQAAPVTEVAR
ncbi:PLP-dependent aminotransferase family protein [Kitasatospora aureofaciens]|uniref:aminotransferase-like domain-containing protein n=1 Tax=Kitasatospora aureofaciens TaxID=1894 RepID=UPI001C47B178|nr:PLP-dependent aminotransferase family protein [Kitasatospora aureofaciens]MBV6702751.1 PLP-dependent aminotransferase family protein [Kitasatospora aureofaciens]